MSVSIFDLNPGTTLASGDVLPFVDISDSTQSPQGSTLKITCTNFFATIKDPVNITSASAVSLAVGLNGATNPAFAVDSSTASQAAGLKVTGAVAAGTVAVVVVSSGADANMTVNAKGIGTIGIGTVSTGRVTITPVTTITGSLTLSAALVYGGVTLTNAVTGTGNMVLSASPTLTGTVVLTGTTITGTPTWSSSQAITLSTAAQPNITSVGTLTSLAVGAITSTDNWTLTKAGTVSIALTRSGSATGSAYVTFDNSSPRWAAGLNARGTANAWELDNSALGATAISVAAATSNVTFTGLTTHSAGVTVASGQTLTVTGATITGLTAASVGAGTYPAGAHVFAGAVSGITTLAIGGAFSGATTGAFSGLLSANAGLTVASGQTLTVTGATITGLTAASIGAGTFPAGAFVFAGAVSGITTLAIGGALSGVTTIATSSTINSQTISATASFTGSVTVASGFTVSAGTALFSGINSTTFTIGTAYASFGANYTTASLSGTSGAGWRFGVTSGTNGYLYHDATGSHLATSSAVAIEFLPNNTLALTLASGGAATFATSVATPHLVGGGSAPGIAANAPAGTGRSASISGTDVSGVITLGTGTSCSTGEAVTITFATAFAVAPKAVVLTPANDIAVNRPAPGTFYFWIDQPDITTTDFDISLAVISGSTADSQTYKWFYQVIA